MCELEDINIAIGLRQTQSSNTTSIMTILTRHIGQIQFQLNHCQVVIRNRHQTQLSRSSFDRRQSSRFNHSKKLIQHLFEFHRKNYILIHFKSTKRLNNLPGEIL